VNAQNAATNPAMSAPRTVVRYGKRTRLLLSALLAFHIVATLAWLLPGSALRGDLQPVTDRYIGYSGLWQNWGMFAPEPSNRNLYIHAVVTYADGSEQQWSFPRMNQLDFFNRYRLERFRKYEEYAHLDSYAGIWPDLARWIARQNNRDPGNPPVHVQLIRSWWLVPPPPANGDIGHDPPHDWNHYPFFDMPIARSDL
jgi:hypothetical protein